MMQEQRREAAEGENVCVVGEEEVCRFMQNTFF
jgi:hypothetical protein